MSEEWEGGREPGGGVGPGGGIEPRGGVEPAPGTADDEPTLETVAPAPVGWASRLEKLAAARKERRRKMATRFWFTAIPVVVLVVVVMVLLSVFGGLGGGESPLSTTTTVARQPVEGSGLLLVQEDGVLSLAMLLQPWDTGGVVLAIPGIALLESKGAFKTLAEMYEQGAAAEVGQALGHALDLLVGPVATVQWADLRVAMTEVKVESPPESTAQLGAEGAELLGQGLRALIAERVSSLGRGLWDDLHLGGDARGFREAVGLDATSMAANVWMVGVLGGTVVQGDGFIYLEPNVEEVKELLGASSRPAMISVQVKDGAGVTGAATQAGDLLESAGYVLLPMSYADGFPEVERTQIVVAPGNTEEAQQVQALLGVGDVIEDANLDAEQVVVVLGKDFAPGSPAGSEGAGQE